MAVLSPAELESALTGLDGWHARDGALRKRYEFADFAAALAYANRVGEAAEAADHHPDLFVTWGAVEVAWVSHSEGGITPSDVTMARRSDELSSPAI
jgi:4a-hydroxytetrahydrobiopterin dehydratase